MNPRHAPGLHGIFASWLKELLGETFLDLCQMGGGWAHFIESRIWHLCFSDACYNSRTQNLGPGQSRFKTS